MRVGGSGVSYTPPPAQSREPGVLKSDPVIKAVALGPTPLPPAHPLYPIFFSFGPLFFYLFFCLVFCSIFVQKWSQNGSQNGPKSLEKVIQNLDTFWRTFWSGFGTLPPSQSSQNAERVVEFSSCVFFGSVQSLDSILPVLGSKMTPFRLQKRVQNHAPILVTFWAPF